MRLQAQSVDSQPNKKPKKTGGKGSVALLKNSKQFGCVFQDIGPPKSKSILRKGTKSLGLKRSVHFSKGALRHVKNSDRSPYASKFEGRFQERCARRDAWKMAKGILNLKEKDKATFYSSSDVWRPAAPSSTIPGKDNLLSVLGLQSTC